MCVLSIQQHVLQFVLSITQLTIRKRQERDTRSISSMEGEGKRKTVHHLQRDWELAWLVRNEKYFAAGNVILREMNVTDKKILLG